MPSAYGHGPTRVVLYARRYDRKDNFSIAGQLKELREHAHAEGHEVAEEIQDPWAKRWTLDRPGVERIRELALLGGVDEVWAWRWDRFGESLWPEVLGLELEEYGVRLRSLDDSGEGEIAERSRMGKLQKAREGRLIAGKAPAYGFDFNETRDGYVVNEEQMRVVRRIFEWVVLDRLSITGVVNRLQDGGVRSPSGVGRWDRGQIRNMINSDIYRPHAKEDLTELGVAPRVVASLPDGLYGVAWYGKRRVKLKARAKAEVTKKDPKEWIPVPVVDAGLERDLVDAARLAIADNKAPSKNADRFWELSGGIVCCGDCGRRMLATSRKRKVSREGSSYYYYYVCQCGRYSWDDRCSHNRHHSATELERQVWEGVSGFLSDPERMRRGLEELVAHEAKEDGGLDAAFAYWGETLSQVKVKSERLLDLYLEGALEKGRYDERARGLEAQEKEARAELEKVKARKQTIEQAERDIEGVIESYSAAIPDELERLEPEERHRIYKMLSLRVKLANSGIATMEGTISLPQNGEHVNSGCR